MEVVNSCKITWFVSSSVMVGVGDFIVDIVVPF